MTAGKEGAAGFAVLDADGRPIPEALAALAELITAAKRLAEQVEEGAFDYLGPDHPDSAVIAVRAAIARVGDAMLPERKRDMAAEAAEANLRG